MEKQLFNDLLQSAREMVAIEKGEMPITAFRTHEIEVPNVKHLRSDLHLTQEELSKAVGVSTALVQSWEAKRRFPSGAALKILRLLEKDASFLEKLQTV
ncbi:MAG: helix-turn-helix domain-containing protein [Neisseriaceae bacterium]|nr:helix-turn-helix domain-containing protein [Neisseriaceae bacterium]